LVRARALHDSRTVLEVWRAHGVRGLCASICLLSACSRTGSEQRAHVESLMRHRTQIDAHMASESGPLTAAQRSRFKGLAFYPPRFDLVFEVQLQGASAQDTVGFITSTGTFDRYVRLGVFRFEFESSKHELTLFRALEGGTLFLPFSDRTSGDDTYDAGRYLDAQLLEDGRYRLDFNRAYNPYCAYNDKWVCPMPPPENRLDFPVRAGERNFPYESG
jgi:uncharacterized protein (DUF1684 family)